MRILIDFTQIPLKKVGVGVYALHTFTEMLKRYNKDEFYLLVQDDDKELLNFQEFGTHVKLLKVKSRLFRKLPLRFFLEQFLIPYHSLKHKVDVIHSLHYSYPLMPLKAKKVITIHDLTFFVYPELHTPVKRHFFKWFIKKAAKSHNEIICVSESTAQDLMKYVTEYNCEINTIPLASEIPDLGTLMDVDISEFRIPDKYILFIGTLEPRKNIDGLIRAYASIKDSVRHKLVIVGKKGWFYDSIFRLVEQYNLQDRVVFTGFVSENQKFRLLQRADVFVYPSYYEGFGLPVLEAIQMGIPTVTSNVSSLPEVGGDGALFVSPDNITEMSDAIMTLINNPDERSRLMEAGKRHAKCFSWENTAVSTHELYEKIVKKE